ncbi:MAG: TetR/AcrR family transcriptional regulator [Thermoanaerobaculia bacterium]
MPTKSKEELVEEFRIASIQEAAMRVIARKGVAGASMQEIADEAGIAKGTIYLYFQNQRDLLERTVDYAFSKLGTHLEAALAGEGTHVERLERMVRTKMQFLEGNLDLFQLYATTKFSGPPDSAQSRCDRVMRPQYQSYFARLEAFIREAIEAGEIRPMPPQRLALFLEEGVVAVILARLGESPPQPLEDELRWMMDAILYGIATTTRSTC